MNSMTKGPKFLTRPSLSQDGANGLLGATALGLAGLELGLEPGVVTAQGQPMADPIV